MLRTVRSLPSLRLFAQQEAHVVSKAITKTEITTGTLFQPQAEAIRHVHSTTKKSTVLLDSHNNSKYTTMNLNGLKMECKKRGLKVSGKKIELIQRLSQSDSSPVEGARSLNTDAKSASNVSATSAILTKPIPPFAKSDRTPSKIAQELMKSSSKTAERNLKMEDEIKKQLKTRIANEKKDVAEIKAKESAKNSAIKKAKDSERQLQEQRAREEVRLQTERVREHERLASEQRSRELSLVQKRAKDAASVKAKEHAQALKEQKELQLKKQQDHQRALEAQKVEEQRQRETIESAIKQQNIGKIQSDTLVNANAKSQIVLQAREQLKARAEQERQRKSKQEQQQTHKEKSELTLRDKVFFAGFGATTASWWFFGSS